MNTIKVLPFLLLLVNMLNAQKLLTKPEYIRVPEDSLFSINLDNSLNKLYYNLLSNSSIDNYIIDDHKALVRATLNVVKDYHDQFKADSLKKVVHQISNVYPLKNNHYKVKLDGYLIKSKTVPILLYSISLIAIKEHKDFKYSIPLWHNTQFWKTKKIGLITYHYRDSLKVECAKLFDLNNKKIAEKFEVQPEPLHMYMVHNYQEILNLRGITYAVNENGLYRDGYGVVDRTIFSVMNNEDFSHDMVHYYSGKVNQRENRNWVTEEGLAYLWGNAYYTDTYGDMITQERLVLKLKRYIKLQPNTNLFQLFTEDILIFKSIAPEVSLRSVIAGILLNEIEHKTGMPGILEMINVGRQDQLSSFLRESEKYLEITADNFDSKVKLFLKNY